LIGSNYDKLFGLYFKGIAKTEAKSALLEDEAKSALPEALARSA
jgi:hypothetical protein